MSPIQPGLTSFDERISTEIQPHVAVAHRNVGERLAKRAVDVVVAGTVLTLLSPMVIVAMLALKLEGRPVIYRQTRLGRGGRIFYLHKLYSNPMRTRFGAILRRFSIDELPQLVNVIKGDMSLVGPRPVASAEALRYKPGQLRRFAVEPGLTCLWQTSRTNDSGFDEWMRLDLAYVDGWSLGLDLRILLRTVRVALTLPR